MMTREEAIALFEKQLTAAQVVLDSGFGSNPGENNSLYRRRKEMAEIALSAARRREKPMANKPVIGYQVCPHCGGKVLVIWDGNRKETCMYCKKQFRVQRQKLKNTMRVKRPPEGEED